MSLAKRIEVVTEYTLRCCDCGRESSTITCTRLSEAVMFFASSGWVAHPRSILSVLCERCGTLYPDFRAIDYDIENEIPFLGWRSQQMIDLPRFIRAHLGAAHTGNTPGNMGQCVGLVEVWLDANAKPRIPGNAMDLLGNADRKVYLATPNMPDNYPPPGAVLCWSSAMGAGYGHCAVVVASNSMHVVVFEQNNPDGSPPSVATHGYQNVTGWLSW